MRTGNGSRNIVREQADATGLDLALGIHDCLFGIGVVVAAREGLAGLVFVDDASEVDACVSRFLRHWGRSGLTADLDRTAELLLRALSAPRDTPPVVLIGTNFERRVWRALLDIPFATTTSYGAIARAIGAPGAARAVGRAVGRNNLALVVPCHRVIGADGSLTGFRGGLDLKRAMLGWEAAQARQAGPLAA